MTLKRTPLKRNPKAPRSKGGRGEREVVELLKAKGWTEAHRNFASGGYGGADIVNVPGYAFEVKFHERTSIWPWIEQVKEAASPTETPIVAFRRSRSEWMACLPLEDLLALMRGNEL